MKWNFILGEKNQAVTLTDKMDRDSVEHINWFTVQFLTWITTTIWQYALSAPNSATLQSSGCSPFSFPWRRMLPFRQSHQCLQITQVAFEFQALGQLQKPFGITFILVFKHLIWHVCFFMSCCSPNHNLFRNQTVFRAWTWQVSKSESK